MTKSALPQLDISVFEPQILWLLVIFGILYFVVKNVIAPYFFDAIEGRENFVENNLAEIKKLQKKAVYLSDDYNERLKQAYSESSKKIAAVRQEVSTKISVKRQELVLDAQKRMEELSIRLNSDLQQTRIDFKIEADSIVDLVSKKLSIEKVSADITDYLKK